MRRLRQSGRIQQGGARRRRCDGDVLAGSDRPFLLASGTAGLAHGREATEKDQSPFHGPGAPRGGSENLALQYVDRGVRTVSVRFAPTVHGDGDHGFIAAHFGWIGTFFAMDMPASSALTQELLGWTPTGPTRVEDLDGGSYFRG